MSLFPPPKHARGLTWLVLTLRISSKSSLNPSATEASQNFLNFSFIACSFFSRSGPLGGRNEGSSVGGGEGDGEYFRGAFCGSAVVATGLPRSIGFVSSPSESEEEDGDEEDFDDDDSESDSEADEAFLAAMGMVVLVNAMVVVSSSDSEDDEDNDDELEEAALRFRFLLRRLGAGFAAAAGGIVKGRTTQQLEANHRKRKRPGFRVRVSPNLILIS